MCNLHIHAMVAIGHPPLPSTPASQRHAISSGASFARRLAWLVALLGLACVDARADDPVHGQTLYAAQCASCHGSSPLTSNSNKIYNGRNARSVIDAAIGSVADMNSLRASYLSGGTALADVAAYLGNSPTTLSFASTAVGSTAAAQTVTVYASLKTGNSISGLTVSTSGDFARSGGSCATTVATGASCTVLVSLTPTASGTRSGTLSVAHAGTLTPITIALSGTGSGAVTAPVAAVSPSSLALAATAIGANSAAQNVTVSNTGNAALVLSSITLSNSADFVIAGGTCSTGASVAAGASCTVSVAFAPSAGATGTRSGTLAIASNASPASVSLSGNATAALAPAAALTASLAFGSVNLGTTSGVQTATLTNTGTAALTLGSLSTGSSEFALAGGSCAAGASLAAGASCTVQLSFTPAAAGTRSASLVITHNAAGGSSSTSLSGTGVALNPVIGVSPTTLSFTQTLGSTSAAQTLTVSNTGNAPLTIAALSIGGAQASEFRIAGGTCSAGTSVPANGSCSVLVSFAPLATGARNASLSLSHDAAGSPTTVALVGTGTASAQPAISLNATTLVFGPQVVGSASASQAMTVSNSGAAPLTLAGTLLSGSAAGDFSLGGSCTAGAVLAPGAACSLSLGFTPSALGVRSASLTLNSNASNGAAVLSLSGSGVSAPAPAVSLSPAALAFGNQAVGVASTARSVTLTNTGSGTLTLAGVGASPGFAVGSGCGTTLAAGASCTLSVSFTPAALGAASGSLSVSSNAAGSPHAVALSGTGVAASPVLAWVPAVTALDFGDAAVGASPVTRLLTLNNLGPGPVTLQQITLAGAQAGDFSLGSGGSCTLGADLAAGASCAVALAFQPGAAGARGATLQIVSSGTNPPDIALSGNGSSLAQAAVSVVPAALSFDVPAAGATTAGAQTLTVQSAGNAVLRVTAMRVASGSFTLDTAAANGCPAAPFDLLPGQACAMAVAWSGASAAVADAGVVEIDTNAAATPLQVPVHAQSAASTAVVATNAGAGGCSLAGGGGGTDPTLWLLALSAAVLLWQRRSRR